MKKILIIEDDADTREIYEEVLKDGGFDVVTAVDGQDGLEKALKGGYSLILLDIMMPKVDGIEVLKTLKKVPPPIPNGPVVILTNIAYDPLVPDLLELGAKIYLLKSDLTPAQLVEKVRLYT